MQLQSSSLVLLMLVFISAVLIMIDLNCDKGEVRNMYFIRDVKI